MKLHDAELVQFQDASRAWQRGRVLRDSDDNVLTRHIRGDACNLIRHGLSNDLEFVPAKWLQVQEEKHSDE